MEYTYTYDNASLRTVRNPIWWQTTFGSAGNLTSLVYKAFGQSFSKEDKKLLGVPFAQFLKLNSEFRYHYRIDKNQMMLPVLQEDLSGPMEMRRLHHIPNSST